MGIELKPIIPTEKALVALHSLIHAAYDLHAGQGYQFCAMKQSFDETRQRLLHPGTLVLGALLHDHIIGTISILGWEAAQKHTYIKEQDDVTFEHFAVAPEMQRNGIGCSLLHYAENVAQRSFVKSIYLDTPELATELLRFYHKQGYREVGTYIAFEPDQANVILAKSMPRFSITNP